jgi:hypothetical protein
MRMIAKATIGLGLLGAAALSTATPGMAQGFYIQGPGVEFGIGAPWYRDRYYVPYNGYAYRNHFRQGRRMREDPQHRFGPWDPYGLRWDNTD